MRAKPTQIYSLLVVALLTAFVLFITPARAQEPSSSPLFKTLKEKDSLLFNVGFNTCDISQFENLVVDDLEFYHDQGGITKSKADFITSIRNNICKPNFKTRRELTRGSLEVYPMYRDGKLYGAIQSGEHSFFQTEAGGKEQPGSTARFTHLWLIQSDGSWKIARVLSYDHGQKKPAASIINNDDAILAWLKENNIPVLGLGIIKDGKLTQAKVYGELKKGDIAPFNTIFNVASITKTITAMLTLKLVSEGKWNLDEPLDKYWIDPDIKDDPRHKLITTRIILSHQTGFANWRWLNKSGKLEFAFAPGTKYQYSGEGLEYLRRALEKKFKKSLDKLADELLLQPWHMKDTRYIWNNVDEARYALNYNPKGEAYETVKRKEANAADDVLTTIEDYATFATNVLNGKDLTPEVFKETTSHQVKTKENKYFGLGWEIYDNLGDGEYAIAHGGGDKGVQTEVILLPKSKQGLIIFTNVDDGYKIYEKLIREYLKDKGDKIFAIEMAGR